MWNEKVLVEARAHSLANVDEITRSDACGCFYCIAMYPPAAITKWVMKRATTQATAVCPQCGIDAVVGSASGYPVADRGFLQRMRTRWFVEVKVPS